MTSLTSPDFSFEDFCQHVSGNHPLELINAASAEISYARVLHQGKTKHADFRKGSKERLYCDHLQQLVFMLVNGSIPAGVTPEFLSAAKPVLARLLQRWQIGNLKSLLHFFPDAPPTELDLVLEQADPLCVTISRREVETGDLASSLGALRWLTASSDRARRFLERVDITFHGYDHVAEELFEILEVRDFVYRLDEQFPFWLFFLSKYHLGLQCLLLCFMPPFLTPEGRAETFPEQIEQLLTKRWFPAMNHVCDYACLPLTENEKLTERVMAYVTGGRFREEVPQPR